MNTHMKRRPTIQDVAKKASLSISTVSLVLNNKSNVSDETRRKVLGAIAELGYHPHRGARGLASKFTGNIGFIVTEDHFSQVEPFYTRIFLGTELEARDLDYYVLLTTVSKRFSKESAAVPRFLLERNVDGVIIAGRVSLAFIDYITRLGLPIVLVDYALAGRRISSILIDNLSGAHAAMMHLINGGYRDIGFIGGDPSHPSMKERFETYRKTLEECGIPYRPALVDAGRETARVEDGCVSMERMLKSGAKPRAIFSANDALAIGCMRYLQSADIRVPEDIAIVGFDDIEMSSHVEPPLTTVRVFKEEMGKLAIRRLVEMCKSPSGATTIVHVPVELVVRESCGIKSAVAEDGGDRIPVGF